LNRSRTIEAGDIACSFAFSEPRIVQLATGFELTYMLAGNEVASSSREIPASDGERLNAITAGQLKSTPGN